MSPRYTRLLLFAFLISSLGAVTLMFFRPSLAAPIVAPAVSAWILRPNACRDLGEQVNGTYQKDLTQTFSAGFVIAFSVTCIDPSLVATPFIGYAVLMREGTKLTFEGPIRSTLQPEQTVSFGGSHGRSWSNVTGTSAFAVFHGLIQDPNVSSVSLTFADGGSMTSAGTGGRFVLVSLLPIEPCVLRSLDKEGVVLEEFPLGIPEGVDVSPAQAPVAEYLLCK